MDAVNSPNPKDASPCQVMDAVNYKQLRNLTACSGDSILLSTWMDDVNSTNPKDASPCQWNGFCEL